MRWLFFLMVFDLSAGGFQPRIMVRKVFASEEQCNTLGREIAKEWTYDDNSLKSFSICIPETAYDERETTVERVDR